MTMHRVVHIVDSPAFGGAEQAVLTLLGALTPSRWERVLVHNDNGAVDRLADGARRLGIETVGVPPMPPGWEGGRRIPQFTRQLRRLRPDLVHLHLTSPIGSQYELESAVLARVPRVVATVQLYVDMSLSTRVHWQLRAL